MHDELDCGKLDLCDLWQGLKWGPTVKVLADRESEDTA